MSRSLSRTVLRVADGTVGYYSLNRAGVTDLARLPNTVKILLENVLRNLGRGPVSEADLAALSSWVPRGGRAPDVPFLPARVLLQDFTGVPAVVDLAAMRDAIAELGGNPAQINPLVRAELVIDHSVQVDRYAVPEAFAFNVEREYERNRERYQLLRWAQNVFRGLSVVPPGTGIVHQVNLEYLASVVERREEDGKTVAFPDTLVGTDSHTTMINGLGVLGYGVGGIEAEAVLLGQPLYGPMPRVIGVRLSGVLPIGSTATDLVLVVTELLRRHGVVGAFVEFAGDGLDTVTVADRATISNMSPEFGATATLFPIDDETITYLRLTGRDEALIDLVERYAKEQALWREPGSNPQFDDVLELDLSGVGPSLAGPRRPQDRVPLDQLKLGFRKDFPDGLQLSGPPGAGPSVENGQVEEASAESFPASDPPAYRGEAPFDAPAARSGLPAAPDGDGFAGRGKYPRFTVMVGDSQTTIGTGSVVIAAITSCTNTSNPTVMVGAGLLAKRAVERGLRRPAHVKSSLAPGSRAVTRYLEKAGLMKPLEELGFGLVGYGCTTCIGNSGPLDAAVASAIEEHQLVVCAVLSGNRNFEGRIHPLARASYLTSPPLVVAFGLAGTVDIDLTSEPLGRDRDARDVYLRELWPSPEEILAVIRSSVSADVFRETYAAVFEGDERWRGLLVPEGNRYAWDDASTYVARPTFLQNVPAEPQRVGDIEGARALAWLGDSVTTDHISPAGSIPPWSPAGQWLQERGVSPLEFNSYGARRGHHEVMARGTFGNIRLRNRLVPNREGPYTVHFPSGEETFIYDAAMRYAAADTPLVVLAGREYGSGSSRDWAAKGPALLGVRAVLAESFERIHRSNLVGMGILPLEFAAGESAEGHRLSGRETYDVLGLADGLRPRQAVTVRTTDGRQGRTFRMVARIDSLMEADYYRHGGILPAMLRRLAGDHRTA